MADPKVESQLQITTSAKVLEQAMHHFDKGQFGKGKDMLQQQALHMREVAMSIDSSELLTESEELFQQLDNFKYSKRKRKELNQQKYRQMKRRKK
ncbi:hypothetical protein [Evansella cellulosilytica]|uniref:Uncharacterized protein n=1 Tax=Evansella cellulosilytica (strain ATCC 21833 / DSM 2522 / FERM P-1141 / JCM 9156 / N-4) TaxID=649639 RepID=E6TR33_EVAC2|nr:hypothetical protein [Evansella cellulosilytica]ADU29409.1 hypothetical protein Bcell_1141 [Evansella cellulosilytica DSM 2522]